MRAPESGPPGSLPETIGWRPSGPLRSLCVVGSAGGFRGLRGLGRLVRGFLPPPHRTVRAVLPHTALRHRSPAGIRKRGFHRSAEAIDAELGCPLVVEAVSPVSALESVLGAGED